MSDSSDADDDATTAQGIAAAAALDAIESLDGIRNVVVGYRAQLITADGFSPEAAEMMAVQLHDQVLRLTMAPAIAQASNPFAALFSAFQPPST